MRYVIVGNSAAAVGAIEAIRQHDQENEITVVASETQHVYSRPLISYLLGKVVDESKMYYRPPDFYERYQVETMLGVEVTRVNPRPKTVALAGGGTFLAGRLVMREMEAFVRDNPPAMMMPWIENLTNYYEENGGWEDVDALVASFPCGPGWESSAEGWPAEYLVATPDGVIVAASDSEMVGRSLHFGEKTMSFPIVADGQTVGRLLLSPYGRFRDDFRFILGTAMQRFLMIGAIIGFVALVAGLGFSRAISRPVVKLT